MRTRFLGSQSSQPSHPISAFTVSSAHSILVPFAMRQNLALWSVGSQNVSRCKASEAVGRARSLPIRLGGARRSLGTVRTPGKFDEMSLGPCAHPVHTQSPLGREVRVAERHREGAVREELLHLLERSTRGPGDRRAAWD